MADIIILGWPQRPGLLDKLFGDRVDGILNSTDKTTFICDMQRPLNVHKRLVVAAPPLAEKEKGFVTWLNKVAKLAQELSLPLHLFANHATRSAAENVLSKSGIAVKPVFQFFDQWQDFLILTQQVTEEDIFIVVSSRKGSPSFMSLMENLPVKIEKYFTTGNRIIIYPQSFGHDYSYEGYEDVTGAPLNRGLEAAKQIGKGFDKIFKPRKK
jgi:hypothetical protein